MGGESKWIGVRAVSESSIEMDFRYKGVRCRETFKLKPTAVNLKRVEQHRAAILFAIEQGTFDYRTTFPDSSRGLQFSEFKGEGYLLKVYLTTWLEGKERYLHSSTYDDYGKTVNNTLIPAFGHLTLAELRRLHVKDWCNKQTAGNKRLANVQSVLRSALQDAMSDDLIESNPLYGWTYKNMEAPDSEDAIDPFTADEQSLILAALKEPQYLNLIEFAFWTGLRTSELVALLWSDIDWVKGTVRVSKAKTQKAKEAEKPKTRRSVRDVKLLQPALDALKKQKCHSFLIGAPIFLNPLNNNQPWRGDRRIRENVWIPALKRAGVRYRNPYQTRHTYASMMLTAGESPIWLAGQMGHADTSMIFRRYGKWIQSKDDGAGTKAVKMFGKFDAWSGLSQGGS
jgi:integrase